jgi:FAD dependent oxidoreductase TIGR03364
MGMTTAPHFDCLIVGRGIVGLAHALAATRHGLRTAVLDRETRSVGASIRNFGFVTVTGQQAGITWRRARRARDIWAEVAGPAGIAVHHRGLLMVARRPEALTVVEEFAAGPMGEGCWVLRANELPAPLLPRHAGALYSPHELRVESRDAVPRLAAWLAGCGVSFLPRAAVLSVEAGRAHTPTGVVTADHIVVCPGPDLVSLFPEAHARRGITLSKLHMLRVADPGWRLPAAVMSDLGLARYAGYAGCPSLPALRARLLAEQAALLADGIHLIAVQGADGSLVVGDSHHDADSPDPFQPREVDDRILAELSAVLDIPAPEVVERWVGVYPSGPDTAFIEAVAESVRLVNVTSGTGASTAFAIAEETLADLLNLPPPPHVGKPGA